MIVLADWENRLNQFLPELIDLRRYLHAHPELSGEEHQTAALVAGELRKYGWEVTEGIGRTGIVAEMGPENTPVLGVRFDMDALPIEELTELPYASLRQGLMHACGHDMHTSIGLGIAKLLAREEFLLTRVRLLFQPAEEIAKGAQWMIKDGAIEGLDALFGLHVFPEISVGKIGVMHGNLTAAAGKLEIEVIGESGHGARPHQAIDSIWVASRVISGLQEAIGRRLDALNPVVISFGKIEGGRAFNVIADRVKLLGTVRYLDLSLHSWLPSWIDETVEKICKSLGAKVEVRYSSIAPPVNNDLQLTELLETSSISILGKENVLSLTQPSLGAEDFAEFLQKVKGCMFRLGVAGDSGCAPLHNGQFCPDERSISVGIQVLMSVILKWMNENKKL